MRTIRNSVFETNSSSMHAISLASYKRHLDSEYVTKEVARWKKEDGSYGIVIECCERNLDEDGFDVRRYVPHTSVNDKLIYWLACLIQDVNKKFYTLGEVDYSQRIWTDEAQKALHKKCVYKVDDTEGIEWKAKVNKEYYDSFLLKLESARRCLELNIARALGVDESKVNVEFKYVKDEYKGMIQGIDYNSNEDYSWFSTGCYDNSEFFAHVNAGYKLISWVFSPFSIIFASGDELDNYDMYADIRKVSQAFKDRELANLKEVNEDENDYENYYPKEDRQKCIDSIESSLDFQVVWPVGG